MTDLEWRFDDRPVAYPDALARMEARVAEIRAGTAPEMVWLLEHPPLYTAGTSARAQDLLDPGRLPVYRSGRGGQEAVPARRAVEPQFRGVRGGRAVPQGPADGCGLCHGVVGRGDDVHASCVEPEGRSRGV